MITLTIQRGDPSSVYALPDGREFGSSFEAARTLIGEGADPDLMMRAVWHNGTPSTLPRSLDYLAVRTCRGGDQDPSIGWWAPHPNSKYQPALLAWHAEAVSRRMAGRGVPKPADRPVAPSSSQPSAGLDMWGCMWIDGQMTHREPGCPQHGRGSAG